MRIRSWASISPSTTFWTAPVNTADTQVRAQVKTRSRSRLRQRRKVETVFVVDDCEMVSERRQSMSKESTTPWVAIASPFRALVSR